MGSMNLPGVTRRGVESLGREDSSLPMQVARSKTQLIDAVSGVATDMAAVAVTLEDYRIQDRLSEQLTKAKATTMSMGTTLVNNTHMPANQIPSVIKYKQFEDDESGGVEPQKWRDQIPTSEIRPQVLEHTMTTIRNNAAKALGRKSAAYRKFEEQFTPYETRARNGIYAAQLRDEQNIRLEDLRSNVEREIGTRDLPAALELIAVSTAVEDYQKPELVLKARTAFELAIIEDAYFSKDTAQIDRVYAEITSEAYAGVLTASARRAAMVDLENARDEVTYVDEMIIKQAHEAYVSDMEVGILEGSTTISQIEAAYQAGLDRPGAPHTLTPDERTRLRVKAEADNQEKLEAITQMSLVTDARANNLPVDPTNSVHTDAVETYYAFKTKDMPPEEQIRFGAEMSVDLNYLPDNFKSLLSQHANSDDPSSLAASAEVFGVMADKRPNLATQFDTQTRTLLMSTHALAQGMPGGATQAAQIVLENSRELNASQRVEVLKQYDAIEMSDLQDLADDDDRFDTNWNILEGSPDATGRMGAEFLGVYDEFLLYTRSPAQAKKLAWNHVRSRWGTTSMNNVTAKHHKMAGPQLMLYPPELGTGMDEDELAEDLTKFALSNKIDRRNIWIRPDTTTARDPVGQKSYQVLEFNEFGAPMPVWRDNELLRWRPSPLAMRQSQLEESARQREGADKFREEELADRERIRKQIQEMTVPLKERAITDDNPDFISFD